MWAWVPLWCAAAAVGVAGGRLPEFGVRPALLLDDSALARWQAALLRSHARLPRCSPSAFNRRIRHWDHGLRAVLRGTAVEAVTDAYVPCGGADVLSAMAAFPRATRITIVSREPLAPANAGAAGAVGAAGAAAALLGSALLPDEKAGGFVDEMQDAAGHCLLDGGDAINGAYQVTPATLTSTGQSGGVRRAPAAPTNH